MTQIARMSQIFSSRISRAPIPFDRAQGIDAASSFADLGPNVVGLIQGAAGCSPFLKSLLAKEMAWVRAALRQSPEETLSSLLGDVKNLKTEHLAVELRRAKGRVALLVGLCDLGGIWPLMQVTQALTDFADAAVDLCMKLLVADEIRRGKLPGATEDDAQTAGGMVCLAMGKMGAGELNYSSDIDLICLFDQDRYPDNWQEARASFIRVTRRMTAILSDITADGYVFRTDLRLRPDASVMPICLSMAAAETYYEAQGRTWERAAYIKARPCGGDIDAGNRFLATLKPFVWRKHLDFAAIQDAHDMRLRIRDHRGLNGQLVVEGHNMKLGIGGIREIEFFTQTRQLIAGGRDPSLRARGTLDALQGLGRQGWLPSEVVDELSQLYIQHRELEHRLQMVGDAQTHDLPTTAEGVSRIAAFSGQSDLDFRSGLLERLQRTDRLTDGFFAPKDGDDAVELSDAARQIVKGWSSYPCLRTDRAQSVFRRLQPSLLRALSRAAHPDEALAALDQFLAGLPSGVQIFSLFEANPPLVDLIVDIAGTAPRLAQYLSRNASVLDAVIGGSFFEPWPSRAVLVQEIAKALSETPDYERKLDVARRWTKEWHFRIGVHHLRGLIDGFEAGKQYADLAEAVTVALWPVVCAEFIGKHGPLPGRGAILLGMGSLGAGRLNAGSDLDLILIYDADGIETSKGQRPLPSKTYYARLTQAMVTSLSAQTAEGRLYEVDVRLRPSGRQGPVATSLQAFQDYQLTQAWTWEHLALTRARVIAGDTMLAQELDAFRREILQIKSLGDQIKKDVHEMRQRLAAAKPGTGGFDAKFGAGKMMDIELMAQTIALIAASPVRQVERQIASAGKLANVSDSDQTRLLNAYRLFWRLQCAMRLLSSGEIKSEDLGEGGVAFLLRETAMASQSDLIAAVEDMAHQSAAIIESFLQGVPSWGEKQC